LTAKGFGRAGSPIAAACVFAVAGLAGVTEAYAFQLVTKDEAALPDAAVAAIETRGSPTRRPVIIVVKPPPQAGMMHSPLDLRIEFHAFGGAAIDPSTVVMTYLKNPAVDITQRITPYITANGVEISQVEVPPGKHQFWIELKDGDGRIGGSAFSFQVVP
jgi:hypothetical protein